MAGVKPAEINVAELHDCFTVMGAIGTEVIGKAEPGGGARYWVEGCAEVTGACGINTSGGLIAKGHPIGATGIAMIGWSAWQLAGKAPKELQVARPRYAATFNIGGPICASVCTVLARLVRTKFPAMAPAAATSCRDPSGPASPFRPAAT
jgi:acetyl-CoA acetyltransferase